MTSCYEGEEHLPKVNKVGYFVCTKPYSSKITTATLIIVLLMRYPSTLYIYRAVIKNKNNPDKHNKPRALSKPKKSGYPADKN